MRERKGKERGRDGSGTAARGILTCETRTNEGTWKRRAGEREKWKRVTAEGGEKIEERKMRRSDEQERKGEVLNRRGIKERKEGDKK